MGEFTNALMTDDDLPSLGTVQWTELDRTYPRMTFIASGGFWLIAGLVGLPLTASGVIELPFVLVLVAWAIVGIPSLLSYPAARVKRYALREQDLMFHEGLLWKSTTVIPRNRIQHIAIESGPLERWYGLATLKCYGAGGQQADLVVPGLQQPLAERLRQYLLNEPEPTLGEHEVADDAD